MGPLNGEYHRDLNINALRRRFFNQGSSFETPLLVAGKGTEGNHTGIVLVDHMGTTIEIPSSIPDYLPTRSLGSSYPRALVSLWALKRRTHCLGLRLERRVGLL